MPDLVGRLHPALRPPAGDVVLASAMALFALGDVTLSPDWRGNLAVNSVVVTVSALGLAWRRRAPLAVLALVVAGTGGLALAFGSSQTWAGLFLLVVAVYSAIVHGRSPAAAIVLALTGVAVRDLNDPAIATFGDWIWSSTLAGLTIAASLAARRLRLRHEAVDARAEEVKREEERLAVVVADERRRIARELHDIVAHGLGLMVLQAGAAEQIMDRDPTRAKDALESIRDTGQRSMVELGAMLGLLRGDAVDDRAPQPGLDQLESLVGSMREAGLDVETRVHGSPRDLPQALELSAYRIVQEGLTNAMKHAGDGARVRVVMHYRDDSFEVCVDDDGVGAAAASGSRRGLAGVGERVTVFGGRLHVGPRRGGGWELRAVFPTTS